MLIKEALRIHVISFVFNLVPKCFSKKNILLWTKSELLEWEKWRLFHGREKEHFLKRHGLAPMGTIQWGFQLRTCVVSVWQIRDWHHLTQLWIEVFFILWSVSLCCSVEAVVLVLYEICLLHQQNLMSFNKNPVSKEKVIWTFENINEPTEADFSTHSSSCANTEVMVAQNGHLYACKDTPVWF